METRTVTASSRSGPGKSVVTSLTVPQAAKVCAAKKGDRFANDLASEWARSGKISDNKEKWMIVLAQEELDTVLIPPTPEQEELSAITFPKIVALIALAKKKMHRPTIVLHTKEGGKVAIKARPAGGVNLTNGCAFGSPQNRFYGRINEAGNTTGIKSMPKGVLEALKAFEAEPAAAAAAHGKATGNCCFCRQTLTDQRSVNVGYGPICAGNYGLPWGDQPATAAELAADTKTTDDSEDY